MAANPLVAFAVYLRQQLDYPIHVSELPSPRNIKANDTGHGRIPMPTQRVLVSAIPTVLALTGIGEQTNLAKLFVQTQCFGANPKECWELDSLLPDILLPLKNIIKEDTLIYNSNLHNGPVDGQSTFGSNNWRFVRRTYQLYYDLRSK